MTKKLTPAERPEIKLWHALAYISHTRPIVYGVFVQRELEYSAQLMTVCDGQQSAFGHPCGAHTGKVPGQVRTVVVNTMSWAQGVE